MPMYHPMTFSRLQFYAISFMKLSMGGQDWGYRGVKTSLRAAFFGVDGIAAHGEYACR